MAASGIEMPMYCCEVRWMEFRRLPFIEVLFTANPRLSGERRNLQAA